MSKRKFLSRPRMGAGLLVLEALLVMILLAMVVLHLYSQRKTRVIEHATQETQNHIHQVNERLENYFRGFGKDMGLLGRLMQDLLDRQQGNAGDTVLPVDLIGALLMSRREYRSLSCLDVEKNRQIRFTRNGNQILRDEDVRTAGTEPSNAAVLPGTLTVSSSGMKPDPPGEPEESGPFFDLILPLRTNRSETGVILTARISGIGVQESLRHMVLNQTAWYQLVADNGETLICLDDGRLGTKASESTECPPFPQHHPQLWASRETHGSETVWVSRHEGKTAIFQRLDLVAYLSLLRGGNRDKAVFDRVRGDEKPWLLIGLIEQKMLESRLGLVKRSYKMLLGICLGLLVLFYLIRFRGQLFREHSRKNLELAYHNLERLVEQRAKALSESNRQLAYQYEDLRRLHRLSEEQKTFLQEVIDSLTHPFFVVEPEKRIIRLLNKAAQNRLRADGLQPGEAFQRLQSLCTELGSECPMTKVMKTGQPTAVEFNRAGADGHGESLEITVYPVGSMDSQHKTVIVYLVDITEKHRLKEQFYQSQKMEAVGQLAGGIAHDFNNLLSVIIGYIEQLVEELSQDERYGKRLTDIHQAALKAGNLTQKLLLFSRKHPHKPRLIDINPVIDEMLDLLRPIIGVTLGLVFTKGTDLFPIMIDRSQFEQVIMNLLVNSRDAMPEGGDVHISTRNVVFKKGFCWQNMTVAAGAHVIIAIEDKGVGMDSVTMERMFDPFFTTKKEREGTGLGLSTVYGIVKQHGGFIQVSSQPGKGTRFRVFLPARSDCKATRDKTKSEDTPISGGNEMVLLVDDDRSVREMVSTFLIKKGYRVMSTGDGQDALRLLRDHADKISLVLSDVVMPRMSGVELASRIRQINPDIPVLLMSGFMTDQLQEVRLRNAEWPLIQKPFSFTELLREIRHHLDRRVKSNS